MTMRMLRGKSVCPVVELDKRPLPTKLRHEIATALPRHWRLA
jgi:hypothetical protein